MISRLKSLELHGYKTFANRTFFEFPAEITSIVGPNGSGKSNVADSLRWVLGEQSFGLLRGKKTEDMIFSGSEQRPRSSMATASISFNNEDGWLPIDFSEVSITRRAYRDGENEYLLNNQRVRLKDISELLAQSGLAQRTYTIIGQGLVDAALSLRPEERRRFFEEAAGIGLYRSRREESLNRLESTRRNMERVQDIISELEPRLESLEKQARRAIEYDRIKADLQLVLREWYGYHWHEAQQKLKHARDVQSAQESRLENARVHMSRFESSLNTERGRINEMRTSLNQWHSESALLHTQREKISRTLAILDERQRAYQDQKLGLESDLSRLEEEQISRQKRVVELTQEKEHQDNDLLDAKKQSEGARQALNNRQAERNQLEKLLREKRQQLINFETRHAQLNAHLDELNSRLDNLKKSRLSIQKSIESGAGAVVGAETRLEQVAGERESFETAFLDVEKTIADHRKKVTGIENKQKQVREKRSNLETERAKLGAQIDVLEQAERSLSGLNQGARYVIDANKKGLLPGKFQVFSSLIEVPSDFDIAIAAALGEHLDGIVYNHQNDIESILVMLENGANGRAILLPDSDKGQPGKIDIPVSTGSYGIASELVISPDEILPLIQLLLGQTFVVKDRKAASEILPNLPVTFRAVTLQGEIFYANGIVIGGRDGRSSLVARPRQKKDLLSALEDVQKKMVENQSEWDEIQVELDDLNIEEKQLQKNQQQASLQRNQANQVYQKAVLENAQAAQKHDFQKSQVANLEKQNKQAEEDLSKTRDELEVNLKKIAILHEENRELNRKLAGLPLEELQAEVMQWTTRNAVIERASSDLNSRLTELNASIQNSSNLRISIDQRFMNINISTEQLVLEKKKLQEEEASLNHKIFELQKQIDPAEEKLQQLETGLSSLQNEQVSAQQAFTIAERYFNQAQIDVTRQKESIESLRRRIEDDFGLVMFEYKAGSPSPTPLPLEGMVEQLPDVNKIAPEIEDAISRQRAQLRRIGAVNPDAKVEYESVKERYDFLSKQMADLKKADEDLRQVISELDELMRREFTKTFTAVAAEFKQMFTRLFGGGSAKLMLVDETNPTEGGVEIEARLPGRREQGLSLLSGGERSLTAVALIFSLLKVAPTPFCILDEVDAMLDEANVGRFCELLKELSQTTQFIVITHNRNTVQTSAVIYGITMAKDSVSQMISLKLDEVGDEMVGRTPSK